MSERLSSLSTCYRLQTKKNTLYLLTEEGKMYTERGSPEVQVFQAVPAEGISGADLKVNPIMQRWISLLGSGFRIFPSHGKCNFLVLGFLLMKGIL